MARSKPLEGDFEAFARENQPRLMAGLAAACNDIELAKDIAQDALLAAYEKWDHVSQHEKPAAWLQTVAKNRLIDHFRRSRWRQTRLHLLGSPGSQQAEESDVDLQNAVANLPEDQRVSVVAYYFDDLPISEVAELCEVADGTVKWRLSVARGALRASPELDS